MVFRSYSRTYIVASPQPSLMSNLAWLCDSEARTGSRLTCLLDRLTSLWERSCESLCNIARLVLHKLLESGGNVCLCDVDVIPGSHGWRTMPHEPGQRETVHAGLRGAGSERVPPTVELERVQTSSLYRSLVRVLHGCDVPGNSHPGKYKGRILRLCRSLAPL